MDVLKAPLADTVTRLDSSLMADAMQLMDAGVWRWSQPQAMARDPSCLALLGLTQDNLDEMSWLARIHPDDMARVLEAFAACLHGRDSLRLDYRILHHDGHYIRLDERAQRQPDGSLLGVVRRCRHSHSPVAEQQGTDPLTGLESRGYFEQRLNERLGQESAFCLLQLTVDHRAKILQLFGEADCDTMLARLARIVRHELRKDDPFARWDDDTFILMLPGIERLDALEIAERLRLEIADASLLPERPVTVSIGLVQHQPGEQIDHLLARLASCHGQARQEHNQVIG
ncbi:GGDEF domain-containing protein [Aeromonas rivuli]|uniref:GGDEF domain-containing protein n=1 Tax=Aeromonas rivuli TaxID=648794 RepID=UPI0005A9D508|nr:sensor domain-containing diguanylate cyclase [Aeromonas rivuli]